MPTSPNSGFAAFHPPHSYLYAVIELAMDPEMITTRTTLSAIRRQAEARRNAEADA